MGLSSDDDSLKQHLVYLLCKLMSEDRQDLVDSFLDQNVFQPLVSSMLHTNYMFRFYLAKLCAILFKNNLRARQEFIKEHGVRMMVGQMNLTTLRGLEFRKRLEYMLLLITDNDGNPIPEHVSTVSNEINKNTMGRIEVKKFSENDSETFDRFIEVLISCKQGNK